MSGDSEEKTLPASRRKLRKAREKGQVASSSDFVGGWHVILGVLAIVFTWQGMAGVFSGVFSRAVDGFQTVDATLVRQQTELTAWGLIGALSPLLIVLWLGAIVSNMLHKGGIPFSMHPIVPDFTRLNPAKGFAKIFSGRNAIEFGISFVRILVWFAAIALVLYLMLGQALFSSVCGLGCVTRASIETIAMVLVVAAVLLLVAGMIDLPVQVSLFLKEQRMSQTEMKREQREQLGTPEMRSYRRERAREILAAAGASGQEPVLFIADGRRMAVGIFFERGKTPIPLVIAKAKAGAAARILARAEAAEIPVEKDRDLARDIYKLCEENSRIREKHFEPVALMLAKNGAFD